MLTIKTDNSWGKWDIKFFVHTMNTFTTTS